MTRPLTVKACSIDLACWLYDGHDGPHEHIEDGKSVIRPIADPTRLRELATTAALTWDLPRDVEDDTPPDANTDTEAAFTAAASPEVVGIKRLLEAGWTQERVAKETGVSVSTVSNIGNTLAMRGQIVKAEGTGNGLLDRIAALEAALRRLVETADPTDTNVRWDDFHASWLAARAALAGGPK